MKTPKQYAAWIGLHFRSMTRRHLLVAYRWVIDKSEVSGKNQTMRNFDLLLSSLSATSSDSRIKHQKRIWKSKIRGAGGEHL
jgi:hypothetical protein